jgi:hypothetical protein
MHHAMLTASTASVLVCDLSFACLKARRHEPVISHAFSAMQGVWDMKSTTTAPTPIETARPRSSAKFGQL